MDITEDQVQERLKRMLAAEQAGESRGEGEQHAIAHSKRVLRLGCFFFSCSISLFAMRCGAHDYIPD